MTRDQVERISDQLGEYIGYLKSDIETRKKNVEMLEDKIEIAKQWIRILYSDHITDDRLIDNQKETKQ